MVVFCVPCKCTLAVQFSILNKMLKLSVHVSSWRQIGFLPTEGTEFRARNS